MHVYVVAEAQPETFPKFVAWLRSRKYPYEGKLRKGTGPVHVRETKVFDINVKEENYEHLMADLNNFMALGHVPTRKINFLTKLLNLFTPLKARKHEHVPRNPKEESFGYIYLKQIGVIKDEIDHHGDEVL